MSRRVDVVSYVRVERGLCIGFHDDTRESGTARQIYLDMCVGV